MKNGSFNSLDSTVEGPASVSAHVLIVVVFVNCSVKFLVHSVNLTVEMCSLEVEMVMFSVQSNAASVVFASCSLCSVVPHVGVSGACFKVIVYQCHFGSELYWGESIEGVQQTHMSKVLEEAHVLSCHQLGYTLVSSVMLKVFKVSSVVVHFMHAFSEKMFHSSTLVVHFVLSVASLSVQIKALADVICSVHECFAFFKGFVVEILCVFEFQLNLVALTVWHSKVLLCLVACVVCFSEANICFVHLSLVVLELGVVLAEGNVIDSSCNMQTFMNISSKSESVLEVVQVKVVFATVELFHKSGLNRMLSGVVWSQFLIGFIKIISQKIFCFFQIFTCLIDHFIF